MTLFYIFLYTFIYIYMCTYPEKFFITFSSVCISVSASYQYIFYIFSLFLFTCFSSLFYISIITLYFFSYNVEYFALLKLLF